MNTVGYIAGLLTLLIFVPQSIRTIQTKQTRDLSLTTFSIVVAGATLWVIYGFGLHKPQIWASNLIVGLLSLVILIYKLRYK